MIYYIDPVNGLDTNNGTKPSTPFKSFAPLKYNDTYPDRRVLHFGDTIALKKGTVIYDTFQPFLGIVNGDETVRPPVILTSYGSGDKPKLSNAKIIKSDGFTLHSANIWKIDLSNDTYFDGYLVKDSKGYDVGFLYDDETDTLYGERKFSLEELTTKGQFYCDSNTLYVYGTESPFNFINKIIVNNSYDALLTPVNNMTVCDIEFTECGGHGVKTNIDNGYHHINVFNCRFKNIGGSIWNGNTRMGNGVEIFGSAHDIEVFSNEFINVYDTATTTQGNDSVYRNIHFHHNLIKECTNAFEVWCDNNTGSHGIGYDGVHFENNIVLNGGKGFGGGRSNSMDNIIGQGGTCDLKKIVVRDNIYAFPAVKVFQDNTNIGVIKNNRIYGTSDTKLDSVHTINDIDNYINAMNNHKNTKTQVINQNNSLELLTVLTALNIEMSLLLAEGKGVIPSNHETIDSFDLFFTGGTGIVIKAEYLGNGFCELWFIFTPSTTINAWTTFVHSNDYRARPHDTQIALSPLYGNSGNVLNVFRYESKAYQGFYGQSNLDMNPGTAYTFHGIFKTAHA